VAVRVKSKVEDPALVERRRKQIIAAAIETFGRLGYHASTIRHIAERAGVSVGLVYQYFGDKEDVLFLALSVVLDSYREEIPRAAAGIASPLERLLAVVHAYCRVIDANVDATVLAYRETKALRKSRRNIIKHKEHATNALIAACIRDCIRAGVFENVDVELLTYQIVMFAHAWALKAWHFRGKMTVDQYVERSLAVLLNPVFSVRGAKEQRRAVARAR
jgi:AcrR family transcriptional regulator